MTPSATPTGTRPLQLASETESFCRVVAPENQRWRELAHKFCVRVREYTRVEPTQITPDELTDDDYDQYNLVLFGSILDNPAILKLYARGRCFTDAAYPGRDGAEIRTLLNPLGRGRDVLLIGGSDYAAVHEAAIGLNRTFLDVTSEVDGVLCMHPLNFSVTPDHQPGPPDGADIRRRLALADGDVHALVEQAAEFALCHYQTDDTGWASGVTEALAPVFGSRVGSAAVGRFALAWALTHSFGGYDGESRAAVDHMLRRTATSAASRLQRAGPTAPLAQTIDEAIAVIRVADHLHSAHGRSAFESDVARAWRRVLRPDPGYGAEGLRDWQTVDAWMGAVLRSERYELLEHGILETLVRDVVSERDNLGAVVGAPATASHAENVLRKIGAYMDSGEPLWLRRWIQGLSEDLRPQTLVPPGWYTGAYGADRAPTPPRNIPRIHITPPDGGTDGTPWVTLRRDLDGGSEYLALRGATLAVRRLTYRGHTWLASDVAPTVSRRSSDTRAPAIVCAEMDDLGFVRAAGVRDCSALLWRHGQFLLFVDQNDERYDAIGRSMHNDATREEATDGSYAIRSGMSSVRVSAVAESGPADEGVPRTATLVALGSDSVVTTSRTGAFRVGGATCYVGDAFAPGAVVRADATVVDGDQVWLVSFRSLEADGVSCLSASCAVHIRLSLSRAAGRVHASQPCRLAWNNGADGLDLAAGPYDVELHDFDWSAVARLATPESQD